MVKAEVLLPRRRPKLNGKQTCHAVRRQPFRKQAHGTTWQVRMNDSGLPSLDVPRPHRSEIANQEHAVRNHRISKRSFGIWSNLLLRWLRGWREASFLAIAGGCCLNQR